MVSCAAAQDGAAGADWASAKDAALARAGTLLAEPRLLRWQGAVHDVPLQWPALVAGLVRAAHDEAVSTAGAGSASAAGGVSPASAGEGDPA
jgi:hypothetical protein